MYTHGKDQSPPNGKRKKTLSPQTVVTNRRRNMALGGPQC